MDYAKEELGKIVTALEAYIELLKKEKFTKDKHPNINFQKERLSKIKKDLENF